VESWAPERGFGRYVAEQSLKGQAAINWDDPKERRRFLGGCEKIAILPDI
jgi:hypothetical protein